MLSKPDNPLYHEYHNMEKKYEELILEGRRLKKENHDNIMDFIENQTYDPEWEAWLASSSYTIALASVRMETVRGKLVEIRKTLRFRK